MNKKLTIAMMVIASLAITAGVVRAASLTVDSLIVGKQGVGGVTFFNGTIINNTTGTGNTDNPVTFGDNVRIDGRVYRGATAGTSDNLPFLINDNVEIAGSLTVGSLLGTGIITTGHLLDGTIATGDIADSAITTAKISDGTITTADLADSAITSAKITDGTIATADMADSAVTSAKITDGAIASADLADSSVTSAKINDGTVATGDLADDSVTPAKINGTGGANLPIAYGYCNSNGDTQGGTSNVDCSWDVLNSRYLITISGEAYYYNDYITVVTPATSTDGLIPRVGSVSNQLLVEFTLHNGTDGQQADFAFVTYKY